MENSFCQVLSVNISHICNVRNDGSDVYRKVVRPTYKTYNCSLVCTSLELQILRLLFVIDPFSRKACAKVTRVYPHNRRRRWTTRKHSMKVGVSIAYVTAHLVS